jgi:hypothetical protein
VHFFIFVGQKNIKIPFFLCFFRFSTRRFASIFQKASKIPLFYKKTQMGLQKEKNCDTMDLYQILIIQKETHL